MTGNDVTVTWRQVTFTGDGATTYFIDGLAGILGLPGVQFGNTNSTRGHGSLVTAGRVQSRTAQLDGMIFFDPNSPAQRDAAVLELQNSMVPTASLDTRTEILAVTMAGRTRRYKAQLQDFDIDTDPRSWATGAVPFKVQWRCPDPRAFGDTLAGTATLVVNTPGVKLPRRLPFRLAAQPIGGRVVLFNPGNDPEGSPATFTLTGSQVGTVGVRNTTTGAAVIFGFGLGSADTLVVDTEAGGGKLNGEYRPQIGGRSITADMRLAPGVNIIDALGTAVGDGSTPTISVVAESAGWT